MRALLLGMALTCAALLQSSHACAQEPPPRLEAPAVRSVEPPASAHAWLRPGVLAAGLALLPGFVLHGSGSFAIGERKTAKRLVSTQAAGLVTLVGAGWLIRDTGTARSFIGVLAPLAIAGFSAFALSWLADLYAASTGGRDALGPGFVPAIDLELGYLYVRDPQFAYSSFASVRADLRASALRASPQAWLAFDDDNQRVLLELAYRPWGRTPRRRFSDGSFFELATGVRYHRFGSERFAVTTSEWHLDGRFDLARVGPSLRGSFIEGQLGAALELYHFRAPGSRVADNGFGMLLARFGYGVYLGSGAESGELLLYYDHRHDDFAAGLGVQGIASGVVGHIGLSGRYFVARSWGLSGLFEVGSAYVAGLNVCYRLTTGQGS